MRCVWFAAKQVASQTQTLSLNSIIENSGSNTIANANANTKANANAQYERALTLIATML